MTRLALALFMLLVCIVPAQAQRPCDKFAAFTHDVATGPVEIVPADTQKRIYFCGFVLTQRGNTLDFRAMLGRGVNCATDTIQLLNLELPSDLVLVNRIESAGPSSDYGYALCIQTTGPTGGKLGGVIYWAQF